MQWIDTHVHLFSDKIGDNTGIPNLKSTGGLNTPAVYYEQLEGNMPHGVVVVDFSKAQTSDHVINSLDELKNMNIYAAGIIKGNMSDERTLAWLKRDDIKGIRLYALAGVPDISGDAYKEAFSYMEQSNKHVLVFGSAENLIALINQIPEGIKVLVDHLGLPCIDKEDEAFAGLLKLAKKRGNVYFKGPGYRTSLDIDKVSPVIKQIVSEVGFNRLILGASDAPFAGPVMEKDPKYAGKSYCDLMDYKKVLEFITELAHDTGEPNIVLYENAKELYGF